MPRLYFTAILIFTIFFSCDHGINPEKWVEPGFSGKIKFIGKWPPADSLVDLRIVVYKKYPPPNFFDFTKFSEQIPSNISEYEYKLNVPPGNYEYIAIANQYGPNLFLHWRAVGFFSLDKYLKYPTPITVSENSFLKNIDIIVDFDHLPVQPFFNVNKLSDEQIDNYQILNNYR